MDNEPIIFLDLDGVLAHHKCNRDESLNEKRIYKATSLDPACCARINRLISITHAKVVIHSSWVHIDTPEYIINKLREAQFNIYALHDDWICNSNNDKYISITTWLFRHPECIKSLVIDDDQIGSLPQIRVKDGWTLGGIQDSHIMEAAKFLTQ